MYKTVFGLIALVGAALGQWNPNYASDRYGIVHLFEWHWDTIADECENFLAPNKIGGVQTSPPNENRIIGSRPWWERYQPVSYVLGTRSGDRQSFINMVQRCNAVGVRIYPDIVINHMCGNGGDASTGTAGSWFDPNVKNPSFPAVPFGVNDFNKDNCYTSTGEIQNYGDANQVRNCMLVGLLDLNQGSDYVRGKMIDYMNDLIDIGVAGFRVDACKHMWPGDLEAIFGKLNNLNTAAGFAADSRAFFFQEVIDQGGEPITANEYTFLGTVTEFKYGINLGNSRNSLQSLSNFGESWGMLAGTSALSFINNHDNQRGHGGGGNIVTFENPFDLKILTAFMLAWPYGTPRVMSSYYFTNSDEGPPAYQRSVNDDGGCENGWVCEHRWRQIKNMFAFGQSVQGQPVENWWTNDNNQIAFSRGNKGFIAFNKAGYDMNENLNTGLADGSYCNVISGDYYDGKCGGPCVTVSGGRAQISIPSGGEPILAIYSDAMTSECNAGGSGGAGTGSGGNTGGGNTATTCTDCTCPDSEKVDCGELSSTEATCTASGCLWCPMESGSTAPWCFYQASESSSTTTSPGNGGNTGGGEDVQCSDCSCPSEAKTDCGFMGIDESGCVASGCLWCPSSGTSDPWCIHVSESIGGGGGEVSCSVAESSRTECGYYGIQQLECENDGCCWAESNTNGVPWCYYQQ